MAVAEISIHVAGLREAVRDIMLDTLSSVERQISEGKTPEAAIASARQAALELVRRINADAGN